jgi:PIN domain nuclease of toxin-antitoxin system
LGRWRHLRLLLDTHALLWLWAADPRLPVVARDAIEDAGSEIHVSVATIWEIAIKRGLGKLALDDRVIADLRSGAALDGLVELPIRREHTIEAVMMQIAHRDPFDRLLIAQAKLERLSLVSNERLFDRFGVDRIWD